MAKNNMYLDKKIDILDLNKETIELLKVNNIIIISDLWNMNRRKLKDIGLKDPDIKQIIIKLQLLGLDLNKKIYN